MNRFALLLLVVPACYGGERAASGKCPPGETCSSSTPYGLDFVPPALFDTVFLAGDTQVAVGGTMPIELETYANAFDTYPLDIAYTADDGGGPAVRVAATRGDTVTLRGAAVGSNELRILDAGDATLLDRKPFAASAIDHVSLAPQGFERTASADVVYAVPSAHVGVVLSASTGTRLVDTSLAVTGATAKAWDTYDVATPAPGTYSISVAAGGLAATSLDLVAVDHADTIVPIDPPAGVSASGVEVCFGAQLAGKSVVGLTWQITVDGAAAQPALLSADCGIASTTKTSGSVTIVATAGGATTTLVLPVATAMRVAPRTTAAGDFRGERAASPPVQ
ncbi:MAG: hypothetical protein ACM31C_07670 [Acidobacteriota bacterium]